MTAPREEWQLDTQRLGRRVLVYERLDSTNRLAASLADDPAHDGLAILADEQTAGRGQHGRRWQCPPRGGVLLSVLLFPPPALRRPALLTAWAAVSVCETIRRTTGLQAKIKWPNDVLLHGRKVCGILIEQRTVARGEGPSLATICGIGLNANQSAESFEQAGLTEAGSLALFARRPFDTHQLARLLLEQLDAEYGQLCAGDLATLEACWKWRIGLLGKLVRAECHDGTHHGRLREMGWDGLCLERADSEWLCLQPETVRHLTIWSGQGEEAPPTERRPEPG
jgi:BirA family biotin operon repressor/biotin-[acetyl-CoA-carboxylase] ligase